MRVIARLVIPVVVAVAMAVLAAGAGAQEIPTARIAVLDYQRLLRDSSSAVDIKAQIARQRQIYQSDITKQEQELRDADQELARQRTILAPEAFAQKRRQFEERVAGIQQSVQARKRDLDRAYDFGIKQVQQALVGIITELAEERGFNLILSRQQIVYADKALDISDEVIGQFEERVAGIQQSVQARKRDLDRAYDFGIKQVQQALVGIITELAEERGFNLILSRQQIVYADKALDISDEVLVRLNDRLPKVTVPLAQE